MSINGKLPSEQMPPSRYSASCQCQASVSFGSAALWLLAFARVGGGGERYEFSIRGEHSSGARLATTITTTATSTAMPPSPWVVSSPDCLAQWVSLGQQNRPPVDGVVTPLAVR